MTLSDKRLARQQASEKSAHVNARVDASFATRIFMDAVKKFDVTPNVRGNIHLGYRVDGNEILQYSDRFDTPLVTIAPVIELDAPLWSIFDTSIVISESSDLLLLHLCLDSHPGPPCGANNHYTRLDWWIVGSDTGAYDPWDVCAKIDVMRAQIRRNARRARQQR